MRRRQDHGEGAVSYVAVILIVAGILGGIAVSPLGGRIAGSAQSAICKVSGQSCDAPPVADGATQLASEGVPEGGPGLTPPPPPNGQVPAQGTQEPSPSPGPPVPQPPVPKEQTETEAVLNETQMGRDAMQWVKDNNVRVVYRSGGGSYWSDEDKVFYIDTSQSPEERANTYVHEVNHAKNRNQPDPEDMEKDEYVDKALNEETKGTVDAIKNNQQLQQARGNNPPPDTLMQQEYETAYDKAIKDENAARAKAQRPPLTPEQERELGERAGTQRVKEAFENGEVVSSVDGDTYPENYGNAWDDANESCFLWVFC